MPPEEFPRRVDAAEEGPEHTPTVEEVRAMFVQLAEGGVFEEVRMRADEAGLYLWDIKIARGDGSTEYSYMRKGSYPEGRALRTAIHVTLFDAEGMPVGGHSVARAEDGVWKIL